MKPFWISRPRGTECHLARDFVGRVGEACGEDAGCNIVTFSVQVLPGIADGAQTLGIAGLHFVHEDRQTGSLMLLGGRDDSSNDGLELPRACWGSIALLYPFRFDLRHTRSTDRRGDAFSRADKCSFCGASPLAGEFATCSRWVPWSKTVLV